MMPFCEYKRCKRIAKYMLDFKVDDMKPWVCDKHFNKLMRIFKLGCSNE